MTYPECCGLADPNVAERLLHNSEQVDHLSDYTTEMWDILVDVVLQEWFGLRLPPSKLPWCGPLFLPPNLRLNYCLNRTYARQAHSEIQSRYLSLNPDPSRMSIFAAYGMSIPDDLERERQGLVFLSRQSDYFRSTNDYLFIMQNVYDD